MCFVSLVMTTYRPHFDEQTNYTPRDQRRLIDSFRQSVEAAETFDKITGQPDCVDPEKEKLVQRVEELERRLNEIEGK